MSAGRQCCIPFYRTIALDLRKNSILDLSDTQFYNVVLLYFVHLLLAAGSQPAQLSLSVCPPVFYTMCILNVSITLKLVVLLLSSTYSQYRFTLCVLEIYFFICRVYPFYLSVVSFPFSEAIVIDNLNTLIAEVVGRVGWQWKLFGRVL